MGRRSEARTSWLIILIAAVAVIAVALAQPVAAGNGPGYGGGSGSTADEGGGGGGGMGGGGGPPDDDNTMHGDLFGDLWVLLRDTNGVPILSDAGCYQPLDEFGGLIPLDEECMPLDETLTQEVDLGRVNVARAPSRVLESRTAEALALLNGASEIKSDAAGRFMYLTADGWLTIDSPLENLGLYVRLMSTGGGPKGHLGLNDAIILHPPLECINDGQYTVADMDVAAGLYAGATDKVGEISIDAVIYINTFLGVAGEILGPDNRHYVDYTGMDGGPGMHTYSRAATYGDVWVDVLVQQPDGSWIAENVNVFEWVFFNVEAVDSDGGIDGWALRADDARRVVEFIHEYAVPVDQPQPGGGSGG